jgi:HEAT repeat protein
MGLMDLFKPNDKKRVDNLVAKMKQVYAQPEVRQEALEELFKIGSHDAYRGALKRLTFVCQSLHWDGIEKKQLIDDLVKAGSPASPAVREFIMENDSLNLAVRAMERLVDEGEALKTILAALEARSPEDYRRTQAKLELIDHLGTRAVTDEIWARVQPYLADHSDDVRTKTLEVIDGWKHQGAAAAVAQLLVDDTLSARVHRQAAHTLCSLGAKLSPPPKLPPDAAEDFVVDGDGQVVRKKKG